jgi:hypothetical protein
VVDFCTAATDLFSSSKLGQPDTLLSFLSWQAASANTMKRGNILRKGDIMANPPPYFIV